MVVGDRVGQRVRRTIRPLWQALTELSARLGDETGAGTASEVFDLLSEDAAARLARVDPLDLQAEADVRLDGEVREERRPLEDRVRRTAVRRPEMSSWALPAQRAQPPRPPTSKRTGRRVPSIAPIRLLAGARTLASRSNRSR